VVSERAHEIALWDQYLPEARYVGEVGIDAGPRYYRSLDTQKEVFQHVLQRCANSGDKVLSVHSVRAVKIVLDMIERHLPANTGRVVLHWFTGSISEASRAIELGCFFSVNSQMMLSEKGNQLIANLPEANLLTETDGPFTQVDMRPACPADIGRTVEAIAKLRKTTTGEVTSRISQNLKELLQRRGS
jgi:TatD DNase family protein